MSQTSGMPAGVGSASEIIWGRDELALSVQVTPGFVTLGMINLRSTPAQRVHVVILPVAEVGVFLPTVAVPFTIPPLSEVRVPIAYIAPAPCEYSLFVLFSGKDCENFMLREQIYLPASDAAVLRSRRAWAPIVPILIRHELPSSDCTPAEGIAILSQLLQAQFLAIDAVPNGAAWWGSFNPVALVEAPVSCGLYLRMADGDALVNVADDFAKKVGASGQDFRAGVRVGRILTTLQDYVELGWKAADAVTLFVKLKRVLQKLGIPLPAGFDGIISTLNALDSLKDLSPEDKSAYDRLLKEVEDLVDNSIDSD